MSSPLFIHVLSTGDIWVTNDVSKNPVGTVIGTFKVNGDAAFQKIGTLSGAINSNLVVSGATGKNGKEIA